MTHDLAWAHNMFGFENVKRIHGRVSNDVTP